MNLSLSTMWWGEGDAALDDLVRGTCELGFEKVELEYRRPAEGLPKLRQALSEAGLAVSSLHAPFPNPGGNEDSLRQADLSAVEASDRQRAEELVARTLESAVTWGAGVVVLHCGGIANLPPLGRQLSELYRSGQRDGEEYRRVQEELRRLRAAEAPRRLDWIRDALRRLVPRARSLGVVLALENRAHYRDLPSLEEMGLLLDEFGPAVGYWHDLGHAYRLDRMGFYPQEAWLERYGGRLVGMHIHDSAGLDDHQPPGRGSIPYERLLPLFPPQGLRVLEVRPEFSAKEVQAGLDLLWAWGILP